MASIDLIRASNGSGNASVATVQSIRSSGATTIDVDTVQGINDTFCATMGTPHTFTDPVTGETITVISEATAVDFTGHVDGSNLEIDDIAPGYVDNGSAVGDIIIIKPTTQWGDNVADVLAVSHNDDGTLKAVTENPGWTALAYTPNTVTCNGNRSYTLTFNSVNLTTAISPGMRLRTTRTSAAPTQCTSLNGTTQYWVKTSPSAMTFTDDFTVSAWVKLTSYANASIASRYNGTSGWDFQINSSGQLALIGYNAGAANFSYVISYQSVPLNKWVHVSAQLDMSAFTATTTTSYCMIDGVDVPASVTRGGTNPTALVQAGNLEIGSRNAGTQFFPGKIAQVAIYNAKVTQANIRATISQGLTGSETSLISAYSFNNSTNDLSANANNLSAGAGSPTATNADSPFGGQADGTISSTLDYAIITKTAFSTNTTLTVQVPEGCTIPTTGGVSALSYSTQKAPYLMPVSIDKWTVEINNKTQAVIAGTTANTWYYPPENKLTVPVGIWDLQYSAFAIVTHAGTTYLDMQATLSTSSSSVSEALYIAAVGATNTSVVQNGGTLSRALTVNLSSATPYYLIATSNQNTTNLYFSGTSSGAVTVIRAELAYL